jgi:DNA ligase-1
MILKPMLADKSSKLEDIMGEQYVQPKFDGIRCFTRAGLALSRTSKPIPNDHIRKSIESLKIDGLDGEIIIPGADFSDTQSAVMSKEGIPNFRYYVFDYCKSSTIPFSQRWSDLVIKADESARYNSFLCLSTTILTTSPDQRSLYLSDFLVLGYEGMMVRSPSSKYKFGRSTKKEGYLTAIKLFTDAEARVVGFVQQMKNNNEKEEDAYGLAKRSSKKEGKVPVELLGTLVVMDTKTGVRFEIGTGFTLEQRSDIWLNQDAYLGKIVSYQFQEHGTKNKPRIPSFKGFRNEDDIS